ncbi:MAG: hypothetical protein OXF02_04895, partial [Simkaniaceae bacterium]|nr:hypothetical protein [Simkaniaceae bacterium]
MIARRVEGIAYELSTPAHEHRSRPMGEQYSLAGRMEPPRSPCPSPQARDSQTTPVRAPYEEHPRHLCHFPSHRPPTPVAQVESPPDEERKFDRKLRKSAVVVGVTVAVGIPVIVGASFLGAVVGGTLGVGIAVTSTVVPAVSTLLGSFFCVACSKIGRKKMREAPIYLCCRQKKGEEAEEFPQTYHVEKGETENQLLHIIRDIRNGAPQIRSVATGERTELRQRTRTPTPTLSERVKVSSASEEEGGEISDVNLDVYSEEDLGVRVPHVKGGETEDHPPHVRDVRNRAPQIRSAA